MQRTYWEREYAENLLWFNHEDSVRELNRLGAIVENDHQIVLQTWIWRAENEGFEWPLLENDLERGYERQRDVTLWAHKTYERLYIAEQMRELIT